MHKRENYKRLLSAESSNSIKQSLKTDMKFDFLSFGKRGHELKNWTQKHTKFLQSFSLFNFFFFCQKNTVFNFFLFCWKQTWLSSCRATAIKEVPTLEYADCSLFGTDISSFLFIILILVALISIMLSSSSSLLKCSCQILLQGCPTGDGVSLTPQIGAVSHQNTFSHNSI